MARRSTKRCRYYGDKFGLQARDLRSLDSHVLDVRPALLVAKTSLVVCTPIVRAIIKWDKLVIMGVDAENPVLSPEDHHEIVDAIINLMQAGSHGQPFELR